MTLHRTPERRSGRKKPALVSDLIIAFDGDDTLWHNESIFSMTQEKFRELLRAYVPVEEIDASLFATETRNLRYFGYGVKGFMLSMIETAIDVSGGKISVADIRRLVDEGKAMIDHPVELLDGVREAIEELSDRFRLMLVTKGDLFDQESKIARSGLADLFWRVEIVSEKDEATYLRLLKRHAIKPEHFIMVGNSVRSDILPVVAIGARAVHVPYHLTWAHEQAAIDPAVNGSTRSIDSLQELPDLVEEMLAGSRRSSDHEAAASAR